jgi:hypothetical protein
MHWDMIDAFKIMARKLNGRHEFTDLGLDNSVIETSPNEAGCEGVYWTQLAQEVAGSVLL